jgi:hypothetical protein
MRTACGQKSERRVNHRPERRGYDSTTIHHRLIGRGLNELPLPFCSCFIIAWSAPSSRDFTQDISKSCGIMPHATRIGLVLLLHAAMAPLLPSIDAFSSSSSSPISVGRAVRRRRRSTPGDAHMPRYRALTNSICTFHNHSVASSSSSSTSSLLSGNRVARLSDEDDPDDDVHPPSIGLEGSLSAIETGPVEDAPPAPANDDPTDVLSTYVGPRFILGLVAMLYGTNFPLGAIMNDNLPASASTSSRMVLASFVLSPFLFRLRPNLIRRVLLGGSFVSLGYISQSLALVDTSPALVSFLGSATVLVCPILGWLVDGRRMGIRDAPQTWLVRSRVYIPPEKGHFRPIHFHVVSTPDFFSNDRHSLSLSFSGTWPFARDEYESSSGRDLSLYNIIHPLVSQAASLCLSGVAALELFDSNTNALSLALLSKLGTGDALSLVQAIGFGTGVVSCCNPHACVLQNSSHFPQRAPIFSISLSLSSLVSSCCFFFNSHPSFYPRDVHGTHDILIFYY